MQTTVKELPGSRVEVEVEVPPGDVEKGVNRAARSLAREMRLPGFRKGKAPPSLVIQRLGFGPVLEEAIRDSLPDWYERALLASKVISVGDPSVEIVSTPEGEGEPLGFKFEIGVRPEAKLGEYRGLEVGRAEPEVPEDIVDREIERVREGFAKLEPVERPAAAGDALLIDFEGLLDGKAFEGGAATDYLLELGSGRLIEGFEEQLEGASAGDQREVPSTFPDDDRAEQLAGKEASFEITVKEVREKVLPDLDDEFAVSAGGFDSLDELRDDIREKLRTAAEERTDAEFRLAAVDAAVDASKVEVPAEILTGRAAERWERVERQIAAQGLDPAAYLRMQGKTREEIIEESKPDAEQELKREAVLSAIADVEGIDVSEEEMLEALEHTAEHERTTPEKLLERLRKAGRDSLVREDLRIRKTIDLLAESAEPIPLAQAEARERLWTPDKERQSEQEGAGLWTPGSQG